jgi:hypothetical protein
MKKKLEAPGIPSLGGILEVKWSSFRKFTPAKGWEVWVLLSIIREDSSVEQHQMPEAAFLEFQRRRGAFDHVWRVWEAGNAPEPAG